MSERGDAYEIATAKTLEDVMGQRTNVFRELRVRELTTQWKHKVSVIPESEGIRTRFWEYTGGVSRVGPQAQIPAGETISTAQSGEYIVGTPSLAGAAGGVEGTAQDGDGDDWWIGFTNRLEKAEADADGYGAGLKYFAEGEGDNGGALSAGEQEYVWFWSGVDGVDNKVVPRDQWNGDDLSDFDIDKGELFKRQGFFRHPHTFYDQGEASIYYGIKGENGDTLEVKRLHTFTVEYNPMWQQSDLKMQSATEGVNLTGYLNAAHYLGGDPKEVTTTNAEARDQNGVLGSDVALTQGEPTPIVSIELRDGWENVNLQPVGISAEVDDGYYAFITTGADLVDSVWDPPGSDIQGYTPPSDSYAVLADNDATGYNDLGDVEYLTTVSGGGGLFTAQGAQLAEDDTGSLAATSGEIISFGIIPIETGETFSEGSMRWGADF